MNWLSYVTVISESFQSIRSIPLFPNTYLKVGGEIYSTVSNGIFLRPYLFGLFEMYWGKEHSSRKASSLSSILTFRIIVHPDFQFHTKNSKISVVDARLSIHFLPTIVLVLSNLKSWIKNKNRNWDLLCRKSQHPFYCCSTASFNSNDLLSILLSNISNW